MAIRWQSSGNQVAIRRQSGGKQTEFLDLEGADEVGRQDVGEQLLALVLPYKEGSTRGGGGGNSTRVWGRPPACHIRKVRLKSSWVAKSDSQDCPI